MKLSPTLPFFHDGFTGYGFNHIEHFEELRLRGVRMKLLMDGFLLKPPHAMSVYQEEFMRQYVERSNSSMEVLYRRLQTKWSEVYEEIHGVGFCDDGEDHQSLMDKRNAVFEFAPSQTTPTTLLNKHTQLKTEKTIVTDTHVKES